MELMIQTLIFVGTDPDPVMCDGWKNNDDGMKPVWMRLDAVPFACTQLISCNCKAECNTSRCKCCCSGQACMFECSCEVMDCANPPAELEDVVDEFFQTVMT